MTVQIQRIVTWVIWAVIACGGCLIAWQLVAPTTATAEQVVLAVTPGAQVARPTHSPPTDDAPPVQQVMYISGAVVTPGVYAFEGTHDVRIVDLVMRAGGLRPDADAAAINLAASIGDAAHVHIPERTSAQTSDVAPASTRSATSTQSQTVNINRASVDELTQLPGVGPALAQRIIDFRAQHGPFTTLDDLDAVSGVGESLLSKIAAYVVFGN
ncbi:MAG: ComEA family DNA-binding protein [Roseiflexaceae bacterium]